MIALAVLALLGPVPSHVGGASQDASELRALFARVLRETEPRARDAAIDALLARAEGSSAEALRDVLARGPLRDAVGAPDEGEELVEIGSITLGYTFSSQGRTLRYAVDLPRRAAADEPLPLLLDPGHGSAADDDDDVRAEMMQSWRARMQEADLGHWMLVRTEILEQHGAGGVRGALPEDELVRAFDDLFRDLCRRFPVDLDRCYVAGLSQTGYWTWYLGAMQSDRWAGIVPTAAVTWQVDRFLCNLRALSVCVMHGTADDICAVAPVRATTERLARLGGRARYVEIAGGAHIDPFLRSAEGLRWVAQTPRDPRPRRIARSLATLAHPWCAWLRVDAIEREDQGVARPDRAPTAGIDGEIDGQTIRLWSQGVRRVTLALAPELVDLAAPVRVEWNGAAAFEGAVVPDARAMLEIAAEKCDWSALALARLELELPD